MSKQAKAYFDRGIVKACVKSFGNIVTEDIDDFQIPSNHKVTVAEGLVWIFWVLNDKVYYSTSAKGTLVSWSTPILLLDCADQISVFSILNDGTYLHIVVCDEPAMSYRRGVMNSDGTITWSANWQLVNMAEYDYPNLFIDSTNHVWITCADTRVKVFRNDNVDGTWSTTSGFPYIASENAYINSAICELGTDIYVFYARAGFTVKCKVWDGSWSAEDAVGIQLFNSIGGFHVVVDSDDAIHVTFVDTSDNKIYDTVGEFGSWTEDEIAQTEVTDTAVACSLNPVTQMWYIFWSETTSKLLKYVIWDLTGAQMEQEEITLATLSSGNTYRLCVARTLDSEYFVTFAWLDGTLKVDRLRAEDPGV